MHPFPDYHSMEQTQKQDTIFSDDEVRRVAQNVFRVPQLYPWQKLAVANILEAAGSEESPYKRQIVLLPTGSGKSLCFLIPALLLDGPTLIIYPLLALMADQERHIREAGIASVTFRGGQTAEEREACFHQIANGTKLIIANPEVLQSAALTERLARCRIAHVAIDEAHCVSEWGDSFRPSYLALGGIIKKLHVPVVTAFTATASPRVLSRMSELIFDGSAYILRGKGDRPNIRYHVINCYDKKKEALRLSLTAEKPLLIFCGTRSKAENMARELALYYGEDAVRFYHAGLTRQEKSNIERWFYPKTDGILCATVAFGMGVDKKDIRTVIHLEASNTVEAYVQEAGRAGRDHGPANAYLLWSFTDSQTASPFARRYAESKTCRRQLLLDELGAEKTVCSGCDICMRHAPAPFARDAGLALSFIRSHRKLYDRMELSEQLMRLFNRQDAALYHAHIWEHSDIDCILSQLKAAGLIHSCRFPWQGKIAPTGKRQAE